jgi:uncharacterized membrane protein YkoI
MKHRLVFYGLVIASSLLADTKVAFNTLPGAVQASARAEARGAEIIGVSKEVEKGRISYEIETKVDGKSRDLSFDQTGKLLAIEEEVASTSLPAEAWAAIQKRAAGSTIKKIESVTEGNSVSYEVGLTTRSGRNREIAVNTDGTPHHD